MPWVSAGLLLSLPSWPFGAIEVFLLKAASSWNLSPSADLARNRGSSPPPHLPYRPTRGSIHHVFNLYHTHFFLPPESIAVLVSLPSISLSPPLTPPVRPSTPSSKRACRPLSCNPVAGIKWHLEFFSSRWFVYVLSHSYAFMFYVIKWKGAVEHFHNGEFFCRLLWPTIMHNLLMATQICHYDFWIDPKMVPPLCGPLLPI